MAGWETTILALFLGIFLVYGGGLLVSLFRHTPSVLDTGFRDRAQGQTDSTPLVSILIPARNEALNIDACLTSLRAQDYAFIEILVLDDRSTDETLQMATAHANEDSRIRVLSGVEPPEGWYGKPNALRQLAERASGEWWLMTDADTIHKPNSVSATLGFLRSNGLLACSLLPEPLCRSFWARLLAPTIGALLLSRRSFSKVNDPKSNVAFGSGAYFLLNRSVYEAVGTIACVKATIDEDVQFAEAIKQTGLGYRFVDGCQVVGVEMYSSLREFVTGFGKGAFSTLKRSYLRVLELAAVVVLLSWIPVVALFIGIGDLLSAASDGVAPRAVLAVVGYGLFTGLLAVVRRTNGFPGWYALLSPLAGTVVAFILLRSAALAALGRQDTWKARKVAP